MKLLLLLMLSVTLSGCYTPHTVRDDYKYEEKFDSSCAKITYALESENDCDEFLSLISTRLDNFGYTEYKTEQISDTTFVLSVKGNEDTDYESLAYDIVSRGELTFRDFENNILLNGSDIKNATSRFGQTSDYGNDEYYVALQCTQEGSAKFALATENVSKAEPGCNYISIMLDDMVISQPTVEMKIDSEEVIISGGFTSKEETEHLAGIINSGIFSVTAEVINVEILE